MQTIMLDGSLYPSARGLHLALKRMLSLLLANDCLSERTDKVNLWITDPGTGETADALRAVCAVIEDNGGQIKELS